MTALTAKYRSIIDRRTFVARSQLVPLRFVLPLILTSALLLAACSTPEPTLGDRIKSQGSSLEEIGAAWNTGEAMILKGKNLVDDGQKLLEAGEREVEKGQATVDDGRAMVSKGERKKTDGQSLIENGEAMKRDAEVRYRTAGGS